MSDCNHDCGSCKDSGCDKRSFIETPKSTTKIKKIIGVMSGKGGVGKSLVTSMLAVAANKRGLKTAVMDADVLGPSIPKSFGLGEKDRMQGSDEGLFPSITKGGIKVASINLLLEQETMPVVWRGPVVSGVVKQFYTDVLWEDLDVMFIDMPPGTGDVPLTVFQSIPITGAVIVTTPQDLVKMVVEKSYNMAAMMNIPVVGVIENMSYLKCPRCGEVVYPFGKGKTEEVADKFGVEFLGNIPISEKTRELVDAGKVEQLDVGFLDAAVDKILNFEGAK